MRGEIRRGLLDRNDVLACQRVDRGIRDRGIVLRDHRQPQLGVTRQLDLAATEPTESDRRDLGEQLVIEQRDQRVLRGRIAGSTERFDHHRLVLHVDPTECGDQLLRELRGWVGLVETGEHTDRTRRRSSDRIIGIA